MRLPIRGRRRAACSAALLACLASLASGPAAAAEPVAADSQVAALITRLGLEESRVPARELGGWRKPAKAIVSSRSPELVAALREAAPGVELLPAGSAA